MEPIVAGKAYTLRNKHREYFLHSPNDQDAHQVQMDDAKPDNLHFHWHAFPADPESKWWWLANKANGTMLYVTDDGSPGCHVAQAQDLKLDHENFKWAFEAGDNGHARVRSLQADTFLHAGGDDFINVDEKCSDGTDQWLFDSVEEYPLVTSLKSASKDPDFGDIDRLKGFKAPAESTAPVLVGSVAVPYFAVDEGDHDRNWKSQNSPYYILERYSIWERKGYEEHSGDTSFSREWKTEVGLVDSNAQELEKTLNCSVSAEAGVSFSGVSAKISASLETHLGVKTSHTTSTSSTTTDDQTLTAPAGHRFAVALWYRRDTYRLKRTNGDNVLEWKVRDPASLIIDGFPKQEAKALQREGTRVAAR